MNYRLVRRLVVAAIVAAVALTVLIVSLNQGHGGSAAHVTMPRISASAVPTAKPATPSQTIALRHWCPKGYGFCADFPYVKGSVGAFQSTGSYTSGTSVTGYLENFTSNVWVNSSDAGYCSAEFQAGCNAANPNHNEFYFVEVLRSKYSDPWTAITAINGGIKNPIRTYVQGNLAALFDKGIYGGPGIAVWYAGRVYYLESGNLAQTRTRFIDDFIKSLSFPLAS